MTKGGIIGLGTMGRQHIDAYRQMPDVEVAAVYDHHSDRAGRIKQVFWGDNIDYGMVDEFVRVVLGEPRHRLATGEDGYKAAAVALAGYESARCGAAVKVE